MTCSRPHAYASVYRNYDIISKNPTPSNDAYLHILQQSSKFHADPILNDGPLGFFKEGRLNKKKNIIEGTGEFSLSISVCMTNEVNIN